MGNRSLQFFCSALAFRVAKLFQSAAQILALKRWRLSISRGRTRRRLGLLLAGLFGYSHAPFYRVDQVKLMSFRTRAKRG
jgi:hypothetical protein